MFTFLLIVGLLSFVWFLVEITRLEGWPGRKWHHAYVGLILELAGWWIASKNYLEGNLWVILGAVFVVLGIYLVIDDASQHNTHNRLKRQGVPPEQWPTSWLHRNYEKAIRDLLD